MADCILFGSGGKTSDKDYIQNGLVDLEVNSSTSNNCYRQITAQNNITFSTTDSTIEMCVNVTGISSSRKFSRLMQFGSGNNNAIVLGLSSNTSDLGTNSDFAINLMDGSHDTIYKINNMVFNQNYTITTKFVNAVGYIYINGINTGLSNSFSSLTYAKNIIYLMYGYVADRITTGSWYSLRIYNRALTDAEITNNYNIDVEKFGS